MDDLISHRETIREKPADAGNSRKGGKGEPCRLETDAALKTNRTEVESASRSGVATAAKQSEQAESAQQSSSRLGHGGESEVVNFRSAGQPDKTAGCILRRHSKLRIGDGERPGISGGGAIEIHVRARREIAD